MYALLLSAFCVFYLAYRVVYRLFSPASLSPQPSSFEAVRPAESRAQKLSDEAFEFVKPPSTDQVDPHSDLDEEQQPVPAERRVLVLYGTEYGFARDVARRTAAHLARASSINDSLTSPCTSAEEGREVEEEQEQADTNAIRPRVLNMLNHQVLDFSRESFVLIICSTTGDGVPPNEATSFRDALRAPTVKLPKGLQFAVLALGDRGYPHFCRGGRIFEELFTELSNTSPALPRVEVDQEDWELITKWICQVDKYVRHNVRFHCRKKDYLPAAIMKLADETSSTETRYTRARPFSARLVERRLLTTPRQGGKTVIRVEFEIDQESLHYSAGDALGVVPQNSPKAVCAVLQALAANGNELVNLDTGDSATPVEVETALTERLDLRIVRPELVAALAAAARAEEERELAKKLLVVPAGVALEHAGRVTGSIGFSETGKIYAAERHVIDVVADFASAHVPLSDFVRLLRPLTARYYSISSTPVETPNVIAITVDVIRYMANDVQREGVASTFLNELCTVGSSEVGIFVSKNPNFRLPTDPTRPVIMIGPGTGIAPFMAFIAERVKMNASAPNWLFFGCRHSDHDFLYKKELQEYVNSERLVLHTAFSRDGPTKIYVQHRLGEQGERIWKMINEHNAHVYICGDGSHMTADVHAALRQVIVEHSKLDTEDAENLLQDMEKERRYQRDVWVA